MRRFNIGEKVYCRGTGVSGKVIKFYTPTSCAEQTMIKCANGQKFHAQTTEFEPYKAGNQPRMVSIDEYAASIGQSKGFCDSLVIGYDQDETWDTAALTIGRPLANGKVELIRTLSGEEATHLYSKLVGNTRSTSSETTKELYSRMMNDHSNNTMLMPKNNGRSMIKRNIGDMFDVMTPRGDGKSTTHMSDFIDSLRERRNKNENR